ncbi:discoidin domain-containing protein [Actinopolymorpha singaporensis]
MSAGPARRLGAVVLGALLLAASLSPANAAVRTGAGNGNGTGTAVGAARPPSEVPSAVGNWLTDPARKVYLTRQPDLNWKRGTPPTGTTITVDETRKYQSMEGFGASFTDSSAWLVGTRLDRGRRETAMRALFGQRDGIGLSFVRQPMGASDFAVNGNYSYDDMPAGQTDPTLAHFSVDHDRAYVIPVLRDALRINPRLTLMASPWSPPGWMKTSDSMVGGTLKPEAYQPFADYFAKFVRAYADAGVPISYVTPNNEPLYVPAGYPGLDLGPDKEATFIRDHLGPTLRKAGLPTRILGYDHNWDVVSYPESLYADPATSRYVAGTAWHCYAGDVRAQSLSHNNFPGKPAFHTECSGGTWEGDDAAGFAGAMSLVVGAPREWAKSVVRWNMALDGDNGPTNGGCLTCRGVLKVTKDADGRWNWSRTVDYYALGHASKFVRPGARRIASSAPAAGTDGAVQNVAFVNPDGSKALIAFNPGRSAATFHVRWGHRWFDATLPAGSAAPYTWRGTQDATASDGTLGTTDVHFERPGKAALTVSWDADLLSRLNQVRVNGSWLGYSLPTGASLQAPVASAPLPRTNWTATASASSPDDPPRQAIDGDPATRWSTGHGMTPGDWFQVDLGASTTFDELHLDTSASPGDFARGYEVYVSEDGKSWGEPVARGGGATQLRVLFPPVTGRYVRIVNTGSSGSWWSIHEADVLAATGSGSGPGSGGEQPPAANADLLRRTATTPDGTALEVYYNAGDQAATFDVTWADTTYRYRVPAGASATFTRAD